MTFKNNSSGNEQTAFLIESCDTLHIANCRLESDANISVDYWQSSRLQVTDCDGVHIKNNDFSYGVFVSLKAASLSKYSGLKVTGNKNIKGPQGVYINTNFNAALGGKFIIRDNSIYGSYHPFLVYSRYNNLPDTIIVSNNYIEDTNYRPIYIFSII